MFSRQVFAGLPLVACACAVACGSPSTGSTSQNSSVSNASAPLFANPSSGRCRYPIVLEHGFAASNEASSPWSLGWAAIDLMQQGHALVVADEVEPFGSVETRAATMAATMARVAQQCAGIAGCDPTGVHVIAHSYGGLHSREYLREHPPSNAAMDGLPRTVSLTTVSTPNYGTHVADFGLSAVTSGGAITETIANLFVQLFGGTFTSSELASNPDVAAALQDLSEANAPAFAASHPAVPGVAYFAWSGVSTNPSLLLHPVDSDQVTGTFPADCEGQVLADTDSNGTTHGFATQAPLIAAHDVTGHYGSELANDGLSTVTSAKALPGATFMGCIPADHLAEVGTTTQGEISWSGFDARLFYRYVAANLAQLEPPAGSASAEGGEPLGDGGSGGQAAPDGGGPTSTDGGGSLESDGADTADGSGSEDAADP